MSEQTNNSEYNTVTLSLDDGTECECAIIRIFPAGENDYIALLPLEGELPNRTKFICTVMLKMTAGNLRF